MGEYASLRSSAIILDEVCMSSMQHKDNKLMPMSMNVEPATRPLKICVVYSRTPLPMRRADQMTVAHLIEFLNKRGHSVDLHYIDTGAVADGDDRKWLAARCQNVFAYDQSFFAIARGLLKVLFRFVPFQVALFSNYKQVRGVHDAVKNENYDVVYTYYFRSAEVTKGIGLPSSALKGSSKEVTRPISCLALQLSQTLNSSRIAKNAPNFFIKCFYSVESFLVERYETKIWKAFTKSILIGKSDVDVIREACRRLGREEINNFFYGAHGTDLARFSPRGDIPVKKNSLIFSGVMRTPTNVQAVQWFVSNVWPLVKSQIPDASLKIVGREPTAEVLELAKVPGVDVTGTVPDPALLIAEAAICINPMQAGGGMQNKLIEYLASGKPIVATSVANEGVGAPNGAALMVADAPSDFASAIVKLLNDPMLASKFGRCAREYALKEWTWEAHFYKLESNFYAALGMDV